MTVLVNIMRTVAFGLLFSILSFFDLYGQEEPQAVWVMPGKIGLKFYADDKVDTFKSMFDTLVYGSLQEPIASIYFPKLKEFLYVNSYTKNNIISISDTAVIVESFIHGSILNSNGNIIFNGDSIFLHYSYTNGSLFLPINDTSCYLFTIGSIKYIKGKNTDISNVIHFGLNYPRIYLYKIVYKNGIFQVVEKDKMLIDIPVPEALAAVRHANGQDWWLISREISNSNGYLRFQVRSDTIIHYPTQYIGSILCPKFGNTGDLYADTDAGFCLRGEIAFNRNGSYLVVSSGKGGIDVFKFDRCTGLFSDYKDASTSNNIRGRVIIYGVALSNNGNNVFASSLYDTKTYIINLGEKRTYWIDSPLKCAYGGQFENHPTQDAIIGQVNFGCKKLALIRYPDSLGLSCEIDTNWLDFSDRDIKVNFGLPNTANHLLPAIPYDFNVDREPKPYLDTLCIYDSTALGGWYPAGKHLHRWYPTSGLSNDTSGLVTFRPPLINKQDTVYTFYLHTEGRPGGCLEGQSRIDTFRVFVWGNGRGGCRTVSRLDAIPPQVFQIYPNPTNGTLYIKSSWEEMKKVLLYNMAGQVVFERQLSSTEATLHIGDLADGTYLCKITTTEGIFTQKVVLAR